MALTQEQEQLMAKYGYTVTKEDPLTLVHKDGGIATRRAAEDLLSCICHTEQNMVIKSKSIATQKEYLDNLK